MRNTMRDHLAQLVRNVVDQGASTSIRAAHARTAAETAHDVRDSLRAGVATLSGSWVFDMLGAASGVRDANDRMELRGLIERELRDLDDWPGLLPTHVLPEAGTGYGPLPLIRTVAAPWTEGLAGAPPVIPDYPAQGGYAGVDLVLPVAEGDPVAIVNAAEADGRHFASLTFEASLQLMKFLTPSGVQLLDQFVLDEVDLAAEKWVADALIAAAATAGTRAAGTDLAAALDEAESVAGARGPVAFVVASAEDLPMVRRALASTYFEGPHPTIHVSAGQPPGTATFVGRGAVLFFAAGYITMESQQVRGFMRQAAVGRPFFLDLRDAGLIQTVTGIGA